MTKSPDLAGERSQSDAEARLTRLLSFVERDPANPLLLADALDLALGLGRQDAADQLARRALDLPTLHPAVAAPLCYYHLLRGRPAEALRCGREALASGASSPAFAQICADAAFRSGEHDEARQLIEQVWPDAASAPREANLLHARACHHLDRLCDGVARLSTALAAHPDQPDAEALGLRALLRSDADDPAGAIADARASLALNANQPDALLALGETLAAEELPDDAEAVLRRLCTFDPRSGRGWSALAQIHLSRLETDAASKCAEESLRHQHNHVGTWHVLGWTRILRGEIPAARAAFEQALAIERGFADTHGALAAVDVMEGRLEDARQRIRIAARLDADAIAVQYARFLLHLAQNDHDAARELVEQTLARPAPASGRSGLELVEKRLRDLMRERTRH